MHILVLTLAILVSASSLLYVDVERGPCPNCYIADVYVEAPLKGQVALYSVSDNHWEYEKTICDVEVFAACRAAFVDAGWDAFGFHVWRNRFYDKRWAPAWMFGVDVYNATCSRVEVVKVEVKEGEVYVYALVPQRRGVAVFRSGSAVVKIEVMHPYTCAMLRFGVGRDYTPPGTCVSIVVNGSEARTVCLPTSEAPTITTTAVGPAPPAELRPLDTLAMAFASAGGLSSSILLARRVKRKMS